MSSQNSLVKGHYILILADLDNKHCFGNFVVDCTVAPDIVVAVGIGVVVGIAVVEQLLDQELHS